MVDTGAVLQALQSVIDPEVGQNLVASSRIHHIDIQGSRVFIKLELTTPYWPLENYLVQQVREHVEAIVGVEEVIIELMWD